MERGPWRIDDGVPGGAMFKDSPIAVPFLLAPAAGLLKSLQATQVAHWLLFVLPGLLILAVILSRAGPGLRGSCPTPSSPLWG